MIILDTNVVSELMRPRPFPQVWEWFSKQPASELFTTSVTEAEIFYGIELLAKGKRRDALLAACEAMFTEDFAGQTLGFGSDAARAFSKIAAHRRSSGRPISQPDAQIAAITQLWRATLATHNVMDFEGCGIRVLNPWRSA